MLSRIQLQPTQPLPFRETVKHSSLFAGSKPNHIVPQPPAKNAAELMFDMHEAQRTKMRMATAALQNHRQKREQELAARRGQVLKQLGAKA